MTVPILYYTQLKQTISQRLFDRYLELLSPLCQQKNQSYHRLQDRYLHLFGRLLLMLYLKRTGNDLRMAQRITYTGFGKPIIDGPLQFNISHAQEIAGCVFTPEHEVGLDIESVNDTRIADFKFIMTEAEWNWINQSQDPVTRFYEFWTIKESIVKVLGKGLSIPLRDIQIDFAQETAFYQDKKLFYKRTVLEAGYMCCVASKKIISGINCHRVEIHQFLELQ